MATDRILEEMMNRRYSLIALFVAVVAVVVAVAFWPGGSSRALRIGLSPYQDLAMIVNAKPLGLEKKYGTEIELVTLPWEEILPSVATAGRGVDIGFASYAEYLAKYSNLNSGGSDPLIFVFPLYIFKGGAFVTFQAHVPKLSAADMTNKESVAKILGLRIGAQKKSIYELMIFRLATANGVDPKTVNIIDTPLDQGFIAAQQGSLDLASAGLTQITESERRNGHVVFTMDDLKFADFTGFIVKKSLLDTREKDIRNAIRMWFDCVDYVFSDIDRNSSASLEYLNKTASTRYSLEEYKRALSQEYLPRTLAEAQKEFVEDGGKFPYRPIRQTMIRYLLSEGSLKSEPSIPDFIQP